MNNTQPQFLTDRLIAFFDIVGFSSRLRQEGALGIYKIYSQFIDEVQSAVFSSRVEGSQQKHTNFDRALIISDSIVLISKPLASPAPYSEFIFATALLMERAAGIRLPLRGAITKGTVIEDQARGISLSEQYLDVIEAEKVQEWSGCILLPACADELP